jgi:glycosyltransferase involved in cell wall biosynthesis
MRADWICSQLGAREHYAVPRALHRAGRLGAFYTDFWAGPIIRKLSVGRLRPFAARFHPDFIGRSSMVRSWNLQTLGWELFLRRRFADGSSSLKGRSPYHGFIEVGRRFARCVREHLKRRADLKPDSVFFSYDTGALETLEWCRERGIKCILNQMDPNRVEVELVRAEERQWPGWAPAAIQVPEEYFTRREREWSLADRVVVNSEFSRQALLRQGVPPEKLSVMPLCYEAEVRSRKSEPSTLDSQLSTTPLRVLFLGQVILRKGIQYLIETAKLLANENVRFDVVGPIGISREALATAPGNMTFHGRTGRVQAADWYRRSHLFVLPTLSDGFAITQLEAMANGLPVIATPFCGEVVSDGVDGFVVPPRDAGALARTFQRYLGQPDLLVAQSKAALMKVSHFTLDQLADNLSGLENSLKMESRN